MHPFTPSFGCQCLLCILRLSRPTWECGLNNGVSVHGLALRWSCEMLTHRFSSLTLSDLLGRLQCGLAVKGIVARRALMGFWVVG